MNNPLIHLVYFIYINPDINWKAVISGQINDLKKTDILKETKLYIHIVDNHHLEITKKFVKSICPSADISVSTMNQYEYPGIKLAHDISKKNPNSYLVYFHTKGMSYKNLIGRAPIEKYLTQNTFQDWKKTISVMKNDETIQKAGLFPEVTSGSIWYNFWFAKTDFLAALPEPIISEDRFYYEHWINKITHFKGKKVKSYSIFSKSKDKGYSQQETADIVSQQLKQYDTFSIQQFFFNMKKNFKKIYYKIRYYKSLKKEQTKKT